MYKDQRKVMKFSKKTVRRRKMNFLPNVTIFYTYIFTYVDKRILKKSSRYQKNVMIAPH